MHILHQHNIHIFYYPRLNFIYYIYISCILFCTIYLYLLLFHTNHMFFVNPFLVLYKLHSYHMIIVLAENMNIINIVKLVIVMLQEQLLLRKNKNSATIDTKLLSGFLNPNNFFKQKTKNDTIFKNNHKIKNFK